MIRNTLQRFMYGRYGNDPLNMLLIALYFSFYLLSLLFRARLLLVLSVLCLGTAVFRLLSRNLEKRRSENARFMAKAEPMIRWVRLRSVMRRDKDHRYFKCPNCGQQLRVPRGLGTISVTCRGCGAVFQEKS